MTIEKREKLLKSMTKRGLAHLVLPETPEKKKTRVTGERKREQVKAETIARNILFEAKLSRAHARGRMLRESKRLLDAAASGMVPKTNPDVVRAKNKLGREAVKTLHEFDYLDKCAHDSLRGAEPLPLTAED